MFLFYLVSVIVSYFSFRFLYKWEGEEAKYNPHELAVFFMLIPVWNIIFPWIILALDIITKPRKEVKAFDYKKFFRL
jgi:amino acid transporter